MKKFGPFKSYTPTPGTRAGELAKRISAQFICTSDDQDWYELQKNFALDTLKVVLAENGVITQASCDVSALWPINACVVEIPTDQIPEAFTLPLSGDGWQYSGQRIVPRVYTQEENQAMAEFRKKALMAKCEVILAPLERADRLGISTAEEKAKLEPWGTYSVLLSRVDTSLAPDIAWPIEPSV
jgi:hypothetical protein